jgi:hypothetical protein
MIRHAAAVAVSLAAALPAAAQALATQWDLYAATGQPICRMLFTNERGFLGNKIQGCREPFTQWKVDDDLLLIMDGSGTQNIHLRRTAANRYDGDGLNRALGQRFYLVRVEAGANPNAPADPNAPGGPGAPPAGPPPGAPPADIPSGVLELAGTWQFARQGGNRTCQVTLAATKRPFGGYEANRQLGGLDCSNLGLFHLRTWNLIGGEVVLIDAFNKEIARMRYVGPNLLRGGGAVMQR